jgi:methionyl-tRNA formyltransferase
MTQRHYRKYEMKLIFVGTPPNAAIALERLSRVHEIVLVITRTDAEVGRKRELTASAVAAKAHDLGLEVLKSNRLTLEHEQQIRSAEADLAIVVAYGALIPVSLLAVLPWWNLHFSLLPKWRGATPLQHSMLSGGVGSGVSLFRLDKGMDTGPLIAQRSVNINFEKTSGELLEEFTVLGVDLMLEALEKPAIESTQTGDATLAPKISRLDARLNWSRSATELMWQIMALNPEPGAWCVFEDSTLKLLRARSLGATDWNALGGTSQQPGFVEVKDGRVLVACGEGSRLELVEVQPAGKKPMTAMEWARGAGVEISLA